MSPGAKRLVEEAFLDIPESSLMDYHVHVLGFRSGGNGAFVNPDAWSWLHPLKHIRLSVFLSASGIKDEKGGDAEYISRLVRLVRGTPKPGKCHILAFDHVYDKNGKVEADKTEFYVPNSYVFQLAKQRPDLFVPVVSIHPYRPDALEELEKWAAQGVRYVKWLPNVQGMDPSGERLRPFHEKMKEHGMILLCHTGKETALDAPHQSLGNPLLLRSPLDMGVRVAMAHCAAMGSCADLDSPGKKEVPCFDLFLRMMDEKKYEGLLFGEISSLTLVTRDPKHLAELLARRDLHPRLVNGSDYPLPAVNVAISTGRLVREGFITPEERRGLDEIYDYNPLLYDFVIKRTLRHPRSGEKFPASVFLANPGLAWQ